MRDWAGTHHVDLGGNVRFLQHDSVEEIENQLQEIISNPEEFDEMKRVASEKGPAVFRYSQIARESIAVGGLA